MTPYIVSLLLLLIAGAIATVTGVYLIGGAGPACIAVGVFVFGAAFVIHRGVFGA